MKTIAVPKDGLTGLKQNWSADLISGFLIFLLALPLSLGIAKASGFPAAMGVLTAMIGGIFVSIFQGGRLTIKGPAAGLITVCAGAVADLGGLNIEGVTGIQLACGVIVVMSVLQMIFGFLKLGSYSDFFPHAAVHGMLAAIGVLIFAKQFPVLLGVDATFTKGLSPIELYTHIPTFIANASPQIALIGILSLAIIFGLPSLGGVFKRIPAPMIVLIIMIPLAIALNFKELHPGALVNIGNFWNSWKNSDGSIGLSSIFQNVSFAAIGTSVFWKYVVMFLFVNSLESLLTVKAIDGLDPFNRKSDYNKDLRAVALGNGLSGLLGGLPLISEVARSSANANIGAKTRWANFFHGVFLFIAMLLLIPVIEMIPNAALAAMLIAVAYRLAAPKEFIGTYKIGAEQLVIFIVTIIVTVAGDLLLGIAAGIVTKFIFHIINGAPFRSLFKANYEVTDSENGYTIKIKDSAIFSNFLGYKKLWEKLTPGKHITFNFTEAKLVDHSFMEQLHYFEEDHHLTGGVTLIGLDNFMKLSDHPMSARKLSTGSRHKTKVHLSPRQTELRTFAAENNFNFYPQKVRNAVKYKNFPIQKGNKILYEENNLERISDNCKINITDTTLNEIALQAKTDTRITVGYLTDFAVQIPDFALEPEGLWSSFSELVRGKDIDFAAFPVFSKKYYLRAENEGAIRQFFDERLIKFLEKNEAIHLECHKNKLLFYAKRDLLSTIEIYTLVSYIEHLLQVVSQKMPLQAH